MNRHRLGLSLSLLAAMIGCAGAKAPAVPAPQASSRPPASKPPISAASAAAPPFEQPKSCPPPLAWEDGTPIELEELCPEQPRFYFHEGECCRYQNDCVAPDKATSYPKLEPCEAVRKTFVERAERAPQCRPDELVWQPQFCVFARCTQGAFVVPERQQADCQRPLGTTLSFSLNQKALSTNHIGYLENLAKMADILGVKQLLVAGRQSYDETPDAKNKTPLSLLRARAVRDALTQATKIPIEVKDGGTTSRLRGSPDIFREVAVTMAPLEENHAASQAPFVLPWKPCDSRVTFRTQIAITKHDGDVLVEVCRDKACSRGIIETSLYAAWAGGGGAIMSGDLDASQSLQETRQQVIRNGFNALENGGMPAEMDGEKPVSFAFEVSFEDPAISESSTYSLRLLRRRTDVALDWSGKLTFQRTLRHPTRDPAPCLKAELEIPRANHSLH